jgi:cell division protease FtsH
MKNVMNKKLFLLLSLFSYLSLGLYTLVSYESTYGLKEFNYYLKEENKSKHISIKNPIYSPHKKGTYFYIDDGSGLTEKKELFVSDEKEERVQFKELIDSKRLESVSFERTSYLDPLHRTKSFLFSMSSLFLMGFLVLTFIERLKRAGDPTSSTSRSNKNLDVYYKRLFNVKLNLKVFAAFGLSALAANSLSTTTEWTTETVQILFDQKKTNQVELVNPIKDKVTNSTAFFIKFQNGDDFLKKNTITVEDPLILELKKRGFRINQKTNILTDVFYRYPRYLIYFAFFSFLLVAASLTYRELEKDKEKYGNSFSTYEATENKNEPEAKKLTFNDVAGIDEVRDQIEEVVKLFKDSSKIVEMGGKIPRGIILNGPPGTGKTLLAKVAASESKASFIQASGSEFVEMYVGVGAKRVRDLFEKARKAAPCIVFIDEIDAVAGRRGIDQNSEREQTLNEILVQMDGFNTKENILVMAATNQIEKLDPAILRPGRFDRQISVFLPDARGREQILKIYLGRAKTGSVNVRKIARSTSGFSGADLANLVNEAILYAARRNKDKITTKELLWAKDKIVMGSERKIKISPDDLKKTAYHEIGHAFVCKKLNLGKLVSVSIIPRGQALGVTQLESEDVLSLKREKAIEQIAMLLAGRVCESIFFNELTTGASNDLQRAYNLANSMVSRWGMSKLGPISLDESSYRNLSDGMKQKIEENSIELIKEGEALAERLIKEEIALVKDLSEHLIEEETLSSKEIDSFFTKK